MRVAAILCLCLAACAKQPQPDGPVWHPSMAFRVDPEPVARGFLDRRGLIHAHSVYSHDACDGAPRDEQTDAIDELCFEDFRADMCKVGHDFIFLTDHRDSFTRTEFPETLLYRPDRGDELIERGGRPVANRAACPSTDPVLIMAGVEATRTMPVGLEGHVAPDRDERSRVYGSEEAADIQRMKATGAVVFTAHTENWTAQQLVDSELDGFEMYNVHANLFLRLDVLLLMLIQIEDSPGEMPEPDLVLLPLFSEDPAYIDTWGTALSRGAKMVTTMGSDCHRNSFDVLLADEERIDSYRRMMKWYSNHLLVQPKPDGSWDDVDLKSALGAGRLYGAFEFLGYPSGFDFHADDAGTLYEMGSTVNVGATLNVARPTLRRLDPEVDPPQIEARLLRAIEGGWEEVSKAQGDLSFVTRQPGAYRAEIRLLPLHLRKYLASYDYLADEKTMPWIYSNPIYVE